MKLKNKPKLDSPYARTGETLVDNGFCAIPVRPESKRPGNYSRGAWYGDMDWSRFCDRLPTEIELNIWTTWPDAGVCIALDHTIKVIDIDTDDPEVVAAIRAVLPDSPVAKRGKKGMSYFYRGSENIVNRPFKIRHADGTDEPILDLLAHGRQTVLPPTIHPDTGKPYQWVGDETLLDVTPEQLPQLPDDIAEQLQKALEPFGRVVEFNRQPTNGADVLGDSIWSDLNQHALANLDSWVPDLPTEANAKRNRNGDWRICAFWRGAENNNVGVHRTGIVDWGGGEKHTPIDLVMAAHATTHFEHAFDWLRDKLNWEPKQSQWDELAKKSIANLIANAERKLAEPTPKPAAPASSETVAPEPVAQAVDQAPAPIAAPRAKLDPFTPEAAGGLLGTIAKWSLDSARSPVPEFAVMSAVGFLSALYGRRIVGPTGLGTNLYMIGIAGPGFGKEHPLRCLKTIAYDAKLGSLIGPGDVTSGSAIEKVLRAAPNQIMPWDEMGELLQSFNGRNSSSWAKTIRKVLLELYSKSTDMWSGKEHADPNRMSSAEPIFCPTLSLIGMATPTTFYDGLTEQSLSDGFLARLTVIHATSRPIRREAPPLLVTPPSLIKLVRDSLEALPRSGGNMASANAVNPNVRPELKTMDWDSDAARKRWNAIEDWQISQIEDHGAQEGIIGRTGEQTLKFATIRALSRDSGRPRVTMEDIEWGYAIVQRSIDCIEGGIEEYMSGSPFEELCKTIVRALQAAKDGQLAHSALLRKKGVGKHDQRMVKSAIDRLFELGEINKPELVRGGLRIQLAA